MEVYKENPLGKANFIGKFFFWWLKDIVRAKNNLEPSDIYDPMPEDLCETLRRALEIAWERELNDAKLKSGKPSLTRVIVKTYYKTFLKFASLQALYVIVLMIQPELMKMIMLYFDETSNVSITGVYIYATTSVALMTFQTALLRHGNFQLNRLGMQIKIACSSLIYKKIVKLPCSFASHSKSASAINLLSIDVGRFDIILFYLAFVAILPLQLLGITCLVHSYVGLIASLIGVGLMILQTIPLQALYYKWASKWRVNQAASTDKRISLIVEIVAGVRAIKMFAWESYFEKLACQARSLEIQDFLKISYLVSAADSLLMISHRICSFVVTFVYFLQGNTTTTREMLLVRQYFYSLRSNLSLYFFKGVQAITNTRVSIKRIEDFLSSPEVESKVRKIDDLESAGTISIKSMTAFWDDTTEDTVLYNVSVDFSPGTVYTVVGATGSGKSSLLKLMLGELEPISGQVSVAGEISYASQEPWLFTASIRENILFSEAYDVERYGQVVNACALMDDFNNLPHGDQTLVGDRGMSLSGGQRARINIARAVYRQADVYFLDDPFAAVDTRVAKTLRSQCIDGLLKNKTVILVTSNVHFLGKNDRIVLLELGRIQFEGNAEEFERKYKHEPILHSKEIDYLEFAEKSDDCASVVENRWLNVEKRDENVPNEEKRVEGTLSRSVFLKYAEAGGYAGLLIVLAVHAIPTVLMFKFDFDMTAWTERAGQLLRNQSLQRVGNFDERTLESSLNSIENPTILVSSVYVLAFIVMTTILKNILLQRFAYMANRNLHDSMFARLIRTPMRFFELNPAGRILNRFSEDIGSVDDALPKTLVDVLNNVFYVVGSLAFVVVINWWNIFPIALTVLIFARMSYGYVAAVSKIKRLAGIAKSPVLTFVTSTIAGLTTIRSCKAENFVMKEFADRLDKHTAAFFLVLASSMAFALWIEMLTPGLFACTAYICIALKSHGMLGGEVGLTLTTIYEISSHMSYMARMFADTCAQMINVERILQYTELEPEDNFIVTKSTAQLAESWPSSGDIKFERVNLRYSDEDQPVLKDLCFTIEAGSKVGIVGRTGAGKSSLITALFRLAEVDGQISIDGVNTRKVDLCYLRSKISIIPQEPILFSATLRSNLDPLNEFEDATLWTALDSVGLKNIFSSLDQLVEKAGKNLSLGQRQLLCLARVVVKNNKIMILDEATANVDSVSDAQIQETIREKFESCTILRIAHRLETIMDSDKILVMDRGRIVEYDHPYVLLQNCDGYLAKLVEQTGEKTSQQFRENAKNTYDRWK